MAKVICTLPNAAPVINNVKFTADKGQMVSEDIPDDVAATFASIPGYKLVGAKATPKPAEAPPPPPAADTGKPAEAPPDPGKK